jgi:hypothetical protein
LLIAIPSALVTSEDAWGCRSTSRRRDGSARQARRSSRPSPSRVGCSVMSVSHGWPGALRANSLQTRSSEVATVARLLRPGTAAGRDALARVELSSAGREAVELCLRMLDQLDREHVPIDRALWAFARRQPGCRALTEQLYGVGAVTVTAILAELGDGRRFRSSDDAVRHSAWGAFTGSHAAMASYSWMSPPSRSRRRIIVGAGSPRVEARLLGSGVCRSSARCGRRSL